MLRAMGYMITIVFFLSVYVTVLAPAIEQVSGAIQAESAPGISFALIDTALFVGLPLILLGGTLVLMFVVATGLRGTSR
jgi:hypothetical protein